MRKQYLVFETSQFARNPGDLEHEQEIREEAELIRREQARQERALAGIAAAAPAPGLRQPARQAGRRAQPVDGFDAELGAGGRFDRLANCEVVICRSLPEAEEYIGEMLARHMNMKFIVFESIAFIETVATPPIRKRWDANGQLVEG